MKNFLKALFITGGRIEYFTADLTPYITGFLLGMADCRINGKEAPAGVFSAGVFLAGLLVIICSHYFTVLSNVYADYEMDKRFKSELSDSVDIIGKKKMLLIIWLYVAASFLIVLLLSFLLDRRILLVLWAIGAFWALCYSFEPVRFKRIVILGDIARGLPIVITMPFGYYLLGGGTSGLLLCCTAGIAVNLFGLFMIGEVWDWKDDKGIVNTVAVTWGYRAALNIGMIFIPAGMLIWTFAFKLAHVGMGMQIYFCVGIAVLALFMLDLWLKVYRKRSDYDAIEAHCGLLTKAGTTVLWLVEMAGAAVLVFSVL